MNIEQYLIEKEVIFIKARQNAFKIPSKRILSPELAKQFRVAFDRIEEEYRNPTSKHYRDDIRYKWANKTVNDLLFDECEEQIDKPSPEAAISQFISDLKANWIPKTKEATGTHYHGSKKDDEFAYTLYFDSYRWKWTTKDEAFQGLVFQKMDKFINDLKKGAKYET